MSSSRQSAHRFAGSSLSHKAWVMVALSMILPFLHDFALAEPKQLTEDGILKRDPYFVDGGKGLLYGYDEQDDLVRVLRLDLETGKSEPFVPDVGDKHHIEPKLSPDGRFMSVTECTGNLTAKLVIRNLEERKDVYITHSGRGGTRSPVFTPDSKRVVYAFAETGPQQLWSVQVDGKEKKQLTQCEGVSNWPSFTPDGKRIIFSNSRENNYEIYSMSADGTDEKRLTENTIMDIRPVVSPDGSQIAFTSTRDGGYNVYVMKIDGTNVRALTVGLDRDDYPAWHPDGRHVVIVSERGGRFDLYLHEVLPGAVNPDGKPLADTGS
ncbi:MAG TPA: hypothetical protein DIV39_09365 [Verrucomicrobiales bacterium]|nr:hypothetical protein [Verrucomicrobiales bacterium]